MGHDFFRKVDSVEISKVKQREGEPPRDDVGVRAYCYSVHSSWMLQVRGYLALANGARSEQFVVASARLDPNALYALRDALERLIAEHGCGEDPIVGIERASDYKLLRQREDIESTLSLGVGSTVRDRLEAKRRAIDAELARRERSIEAAQARIDVHGLRKEAIVGKLGDLIATLTKLRDDAERELP